MLCPASYVGCRTCPAPDTQEGDQFILRRTLSRVTFDDFELSKPLRKAVAETGYTVPTPIQCQAIPPALEGRDVLATLLRFGMEVRPQRDYAMRCVHRDGQQLAGRPLAATHSSSTQRASSAGLSSGPWSKRLGCASRPWFS